MTMTTERVRTAEPLKLVDRCDRCGAQAFVRVEFGLTLDLLFCGHHFRRHESALLTHHPEIIVRDERDRINHRPSVSANAE